VNASYVRSDTTSRARVAVNELQGWRICAALGRDFYGALTTALGVTRCAPTYRTSTPAIFAFAVWWKDSASTQMLPDGRPLNVMKRGDLADQLALAFAASHARGVGLTNSFGPPGYS
jgi:hypothetical protein